MKIWCVCSGGGHLTELMEIVSNLNKSDLTSVTYYGENNILKNIFSNQYFVSHHRNDLLKFFLDLLKLFRNILKEKPKFIISTGAELAVPFFYFGKIFFGAKLIYVESAAQVWEPSITGKAVYPITDLFLVQWESLLKKYGKKAKYVGGLL